MVAVKGGNTQQRIEDGILWAIVFGGRGDLVGTLLPEDFTQDVSRKVFEMAMDRMAREVPIDDSMVLETDNNKLFEYMAMLSDTVPIVSMKGKVLDESVAELVRRSDLRYAIGYMREIQGKMKAGELSSVDESISEIQLLQDSLASRHRITREIVVGESIKAGLEQITKNLRSGKIHMGIRSIDEWIGGGINLGEFVIIGARTNVGKSILSLYPALHTASCGRHVLLASNEMSDAQMAMRMVSNKSGVPMGVIEQQYPASSKHMESMALAIEEIRGMPISMIPNCYYVSQISEALERRKRAGVPISLVVLDHIQRMRSDNPRVTKQYDILTEASRQLQALAKKYNCVIISMAQVNRAGTLAEKIQVSHLEGSGALEQDPDKIFLMYGDKSDPDVRLLELAKNRSGIVRNMPFRLRLQGHIMRFTEDIKDNV